MRLSHKETLPIIDSVRQKIKQSDVYKKICKDVGVDENIIDLVPMAFADLDVSARTDKCCIYFNWKLLNDNDFEKDDHYMIHEFKHWSQQAYGDGPTQGAADGEYLDNEFQQEGFQAQTEYLSETRGDEAADIYIDKVFDHHDVPKKERKKRKEDLLELASKTWLISKMSNSEK